MTPLVVRLDSVPGNDTLRLYVNPGATEPETPDAILTTLDIGRVDRIGIGAGFDSGPATTAIAEIDDIRITDNFQDARNGSRETGFRIDTLRETSGGLLVRWSSAVGNLYTVEQSGSLGGWSDLSPGIPASGSSTAYIAPPIGFSDPTGRKFFRIREEVSPYTSASLVSKDR